MPYVLLGAVTALVVTLVVAGTTLPARVDFYLGPARGPDVTYDRWVYLLLYAVAAPVLGALLSGTVRSLLPIARVFGYPTRGPVGEYVAAWAFVWCSGVLWLNVWLENDHPELRSTLEFISAVPLLLGVALIVGIRVRRAGRR